MLSSESWTALLYPSCVSICFLVEMADPFTVTANLRKELSYMRTNLDVAKSDCSRAEDAKMDMAYELKAAGTKEGCPPFPPLLLFFPFFR